MEEGKYQIRVDYPLYQEGYIPIITSTEVETNAFILCILLILCPVNHLRLSPDLSPPMKAC
jgi:hypothetical protein